MSREECAVTQDPFAEVPQEALDRLIDAVTLGWIVPHAAPDAALLMPIVRDARPGRLLGHLPRRHPAATVLTESRRAQILFLGPNAHVPNDVVGVADWAPTWNFVAASLDVDVQVDVALTDRALAATVAHLEEHWTVEELGARYASLAERVVGYEAVIREAKPRFKLGQDERPEVQARMAAAAAGTQLRTWL
jgi:transcriptional regulator